MKMKPFLSSILAISFLSLSIGCISPWNRWQRAEENFRENEQKTQALANAETEKAAVYTHGTEKAINTAQQAAATISNTEEKKAVQKPLAVAEKLNERAQLALPPPPIEEAIDMEQIVEDLLSENEETKEEGERALNLKDRELSSIQSSLNHAEGKLQDAENKLLQVGRENARLAQKWDDLVGWVWWLIAIVIFCVVGSVLLRILPIFFPTMGITGTLSRMVRGVEAVRGKHEIDSIMREHLDERDRFEIDKVKRRLGIK